MNHSDASYLICPLFGFILPLYYFFKACYSSANEVQIFLLKDLLTFVLRFLCSVTFSSSVAFCSSKVKQNQQFLFSAEFKSLLIS